MTKFAQLYVHVHNSLFFLKKKFDTVQALHNIVMYKILIALALHQGSCGFKVQLPIWNDAALHHSFSAHKAASAMNHYHICLFGCDIRRVIMRLHNVV